ncbi:hypothetical protein [Jatrophihabitans sp. GAS493]|uniref:DUF7919 family protein n=1 Tax=Jatrophihabitans sp. GAS493 TaxID=1907575 RepID=UPI000BB67DE9|nr:hypothetical protein [Jatrophihabitans sp. GAS493]
MAYIADLEPYTYYPQSIPTGVDARAVGWLDPEHPFTAGTTPDGFVDALFDLCRDHRRTQMRGFHSCAFCSVSGGEHPRAHRGDESVWIGSAEIRVQGDGGRWLVAPNLVLHYVTDHGYLPPTEFQTAVLKHQLFLPLSREHWTGPSPVSLGLVQISGPELDALGATRTAPADVGLGDDIVVFALDSADLGALIRRRGLPDDLWELFVRHTVPYPLTRTASGTLEEIGMSTERLVLSETKT